MNNRRIIAQEFAQAIKSDNIKQIILYGSVARGEDTPDSDIDILIITFEKNKKLESCIRKKVVDIILEKEEIISPHIMTEEHFNKTKNYSFLQNVLSDGVLI